MLPPGGPFWRRLLTVCRYPPTRVERALCNFTLIFLFVASLSVLNLLRTFYMLSVSLTPFHFEKPLGRDLQLDDGGRRGCSEGLGFTFPFYGQDYHEIYVCNDGMIALGQVVRYREFQYHYGAGVPVLMPLLLDLDPTASPGAIFARQEGDRLIVTWERQRVFRRPELELTFQAVLYSDGHFDFIYAALPETIPFHPNDDPGASLWAIGVLPDTSQQWDILRQVAEGCTYKEIAARMYITEQTVKYHMDQILTRLQLENRAQEIAYYQQTRG